MSRLYRAYVEERDEVFRTLDFDRIERFCRKWGIDVPANEKVFKAGIYKAILQMYSSTDKEKAEAMEWLTNHGFGTGLE